jgi:hypothetical protein
MGIWPNGSDGTDVNSVHASNDKQHLVVGDDHGHVRLLNNPCVVEDAPSKDYGGHSSHVMNVKYLYDDTHVVSVGGNDMAVFQWKVLASEPWGGENTEPVEVGAAHKWETSGVPAPWTARRRPFRTLTRPRGQALDKQAARSCARVEIESSKHVFLSSL